ncbi:MAG: GNAT family N-acetyltransferase [Oscillospiraceae bacterium]|nr:GNAT family N-acetyltransferase [Oscillospiraceae bacterium]
MISVHPISAGDTIAIRHVVLRAGMPVEACYFDKDEAEGTFHLGGYADGVHAGICTFQREPDPLTGGEAYRLRGMAVLPEYRGRGIGTLMLLSGEDRVLRRFVREAWLHARTDAVRFYERHGWAAEGDEFDIPTAGPHYLMRKSLKPHLCGEP